MRFEVFLFFSARLRPDCPLSDYQPTGDMKMKTTIAILACLTLSSIASAQTPTTERSRTRESRSLREFEYEGKPFRFEPRPVTIIDNSGVRIYNTQAEADRAEKK